MKASIRTLFAESLFTPRRALPLFLLMACWLAGCLYWVDALYSGPRSFLAFDWPKEIAYLNIIRDSLLHHQIPWRISVEFQGTQNFLSIPEICVSPQIFLLRYLDVHRFVVVDAVLLFSVSFFGCLAIARKYQLSIAAFLLLFLLFSFNGCIASHMAVGHRMWESYYYLPWFYLSLFAILDGRALNRYHAGLILTMIFILAQGGLHLFVWCVMCIGFTAALDRTHCRTLLLSMAIAIVLSAYRLIPAALEFSHYRALFVSGYPDLSTFVDSLLSLRPALTPHRGGGFGEMGWWEYDLFIGLSGTILLLFGCWIYVRSANPEEHTRYRPLWITLGLLTLLSFGDTYRLINQLPFPLLNSERVSSRLITLPFIFGIVTAAIGVSRGGQKFSLALRAGFILLVILLSADLRFHLHLWNLKNWDIIQGLPNESTPEILAAHLVGNSDQIYRLVVSSSWAVSIVAVALFCSHWLLTWRRSKSCRIG